MNEVYSILFQYYLLVGVYCVGNLLQVILQVKEMSDKLKK